MSDKMMPLIQLPSGVCIRPDKLLFIVRKGISEYVAVIEGCQMSPNISGEDLDTLRRVGVVQSTDIEGESTVVEVN